MCVSVGRIRSRVVPLRRSPSCRRFIGGGFSSAAAAAAAMAPALTQPTHQRQTLTLHPTTTSALSSMDSLTSVADAESHHLKQLVSPWGSSCAAKRRNSKITPNPLKKDRTDFALDPPLGPDCPVVRNHNVAGVVNGTGKTMGLQPTAPGDRMDLDTPVPPVLKGLGGIESVPPESTEAIGQVFPPVDMEDILDVISSIEGCVGDVEPVQSSGGGGVQCTPLDQGLEALNKLFMDDVVPDASAVTDAKLRDVGAKQQVIEQRCQTLLRRAGRLQSRHVSRHVADQLADFVTFAKDTLGVKRQDGRSSNGSNLYGLAEYYGRLPTREEALNLPTAELVNLVSRWQAPPISYLSNRRYFALGKSATSTTSSSASSSKSAGSAAHLSSQVAETLHEVAGLWEAQLRYIQRHDDPDATESSSGGETDDETAAPVEQLPAFSAGSVANVVVSEPVDGSHQPPPSKPISTYQRAAWRWARDRAAVAARWSWLQAQVADLEYRIRQHTDVYRQLRAAKGSVHLANDNGGVHDHTSEKEMEASSDSSCRTRPLTSNGGTFRQRRLIRTSQLNASRKASKHSTVRCCCVISRIYQPCVLCNGKNNYLLPVDPDGMTIKERIGLVDRGFHPVLSMAQEIPLSAHVDSLLKSGDWRPPPVLSRVNNRRGSKPEDSETSIKKKSVKRKSKSMSATLNDAEVTDSNTGSKLDRRKANMKRRKRSTISNDTPDDDSGSAFPSSPYAPGGGDSASVSSGVSSTPGRGGRGERPLHHDVLRRSVHRAAYDINNIVIHSMAASTRVELLQYKEILTPKWRVIEDVETSSPASAETATSPAATQVPAEANEEGGGEEEEDVEDVSEEACISRHDRSEVEERKKFMSYLKQPPGASRGRRRVDHIDSRAESSGANTPDPMSPHDGSKCGSDRLDAGDPCMDETELTDAGHQFSVSAVKERRRTASLTKKADNVFRFYDDNSAMSWEMDEIRTVAPYETRQFPLSDSAYDEMLIEMPADDPEEESNVSSKREMRSSEPGTPTPVAVSRPSTPSVTLFSDTTESPGHETEEVEDPNDPEWENSQGSAPRNKKR